MLIVTDSSIKSLETAKHIDRLASDAGIKQIFLLGNKIANENQRNAIREFAEKNSLHLLGSMPFDEQVTEAEMRGETPLKYTDSPAVQTIRRMGKRLFHYGK